MADMRMPAEAPPPSLGGVIKTASDIPASDYKGAVLAWARSALQEGASMVREEHQQEDVDENIRLIMGDYSQADAAGRMGDRDSSFVTARIGKNIEDEASVLTDFKPTGMYRTFNPEFERQGEILDKLLKAWWYNREIDIKMNLAVKQSLAARTAYVSVEFDPTLVGGLGDVDIKIRDYRDVIPIRPNSLTSTQDAVGVVIKSRNTVNWARARYGDAAQKVKATTTGSSALFHRAGKALRKMSAMDVLNEGGRPTQDFNIPSYDHYEIYLKDDSVNGGPSRIWIGPKDERSKPWGYWVEPNQPLYPRGRLIVIANMDTILYDGGNPYWHGMFPVIKLTLSQWPWSFLGKSALADVKDAQFQSIEIDRGIMDHIRKILEPGVIVDSNSASRKMFSDIDTGKPGWKMLAGPFGAQGVKLENVPSLDPLVIQKQLGINQEIDHLMGILDMRALAQLKLATMTDVETLLEHLGPSVRSRGRALEAFIRELAEMMKGNFFQFYDKARRLQMLGPDGLDIEDYKFDPDTLVPEFSTGQLRENPEALARFFDSGERPSLKPRAQRAQAHVRTFTYHIAPDSLLQLAQTQQKLLYLQLFTMGIIDAITLLERLNVPNIPQIIQRMQIAQQIGLTGSVSAAGRKQTNQSPVSGDMSNGRFVQRTAPR